MLTAIRRRLSLVGKSLKKIGKILGHAVVRIPHVIVCLPVWVGLVAAIYVVHYGGYTVVMVCGGLVFIGSLVVDFFNGFEDMRACANGGIVIETLVEPIDVVMTWIVEKSKAFTCAVFDCVPAALQI